MELYWSVIDTHVNNTQTYLISSRDAEGVIFVQQRLRGRRRLQTSNGQCIHTGPGNNNIFKAYVRYVLT